MSNITIHVHTNIISIFKGSDSQMAVDKTENERKTVKH